MGNISTKKVGDFQENVGKASSDINLIGSIIFGSILAIIGIGLCIGAFIPYDYPMNELGQDCDASCQFSKGVICDKDGKTCYVKKKRYYLIIPGVIFLCIAALVIYMSYFWRKEVYSNRSLAQVGGTIAEVEMVHEALSD